MQAQEIMRQQPIWTCDKSATVQEVSSMMKRNNIGAVPVLDEQGYLEGIVTDRDLCCRVLAEGKDCQTPVSQVMSTAVQYVRPDSSLQEVESTMQQFKIRRLPVVNDQLQVVGFISTADLLHRCHSPQEEHELAGVLESICS